MSCEVSIVSVSNFLRIYPLLYLLLFLSFLSFFPQDPSSNFSCFGEYYALENLIERIANQVTFKFTSNISNHFICAYVNRNSSIPALLLKQYDLRNAEPILFSGAFSPSNNFKPVINYQSDTKEEMLSG